MIPCGQIAVFCAVRSAGGMTGGFWSPGSGTWAASRDLITVSGRVFAVCGVFAGVWLGPGV